MFRWKSFAVISGIFVGSGLCAQTPARSIDPVFARAQALVSDGNGAAGRALIDSMIAATPTSAANVRTGRARIWRSASARQSVRRSAACRQPSLCRASNRLRYRPSFANPSCMARTCRTIRCGRTSARSEPCRACKRRSSRPRLRLNRPSS